MELNVGDKIQRYEFGEPIGTGYIVKSVTKTLAKCDYAIFYRNIGNDNSVERKNDFWSFNKKYIKL